MPIMALDASRNAHRLVLCQVLDSSSSGKAHPMPLNWYGDWRSCPAASLDLNSRG